MPSLAGRSFAKPVNAVARVDKESGERSEKQAGEEDDPEAEPGDGYAHGEISSLT